jgi:putative transcriptional regulator
MGSTDTDNEFETDDVYLSNQMLIAMPNVNDPRFERSVIFICAHSADGAMGIIVNKPANGITLPGLFEQLNIAPEAEQIDLSNTIDDVAIQIGGPVESSRGFVLHSTDYFSSENTMPIDEEIGLTATLDVLRAIAGGHGPKHAILALGYAGWGPGQLETEMLTNGWLHCAADVELIFARDCGKKYDQALAKIGIDPNMLSTAAGHA